MITHPIMEAKVQEAMEVMIAIEAIKSHCSMIKTAEKAKTQSNNCLSSKTNLVKCGRLVKSAILQASMNCYIIKHHNKS